MMRINHGVLCAQVLPENPLFAPREDAFATWWTVLAGHTLPGQQV